MPDRGKPPLSLVRAAAVVPISSEAETFEALVDEYEAGRDKRRSCKVCDSEYHALIDELLRRGGGSPSICNFLATRLKVNMSTAVLHRHKSQHFDAGQTA